jgi:hypothetical protein
MASALSSIAPRFVLLGTLTSSLACALPQGGGRPQAGKRRELVVALTTVADTAPSVRGMSNLIFEPPSAHLRDSMRTPASWSDLGTDLLVRGKQVAPVRALRFRMAGDTAWQFAVDTAGDLDFTRAPVLGFVRRGPLLAANLDLTVRAPSGRTRRVPYEFLRSNDGYTYGRIAEYRTGHLDVNGQRVPIQVRNGNRGTPLFDLDAATILIDLDGDGTLTERASVTVGGRPVSPEQVRGGSTFDLKGTPYRLTSLDAAGTELRLQAISGKGATGVNFAAPELKARALDGSTFRLSKQRGKVVLISFWATNCEWSASVRAPLNELASKYSKDLMWVAMAKDTSRPDIEAYLAKSPMQGVILLPDSSAWQSYNPDVATPVFAIVDARGVLRFQASGATSMSAVSAKVDELLRAPR